MKCVKLSGGIVRVSNEQAEELVKKQGGKYVTKLEWRNAGRLRKLP